jgi:uncharacterized membrane protein YhhN
MAIIGMLFSLASLVCFIMVLIKQFQNAGAVHGIIGIITCGIWTFIWGWMNAGNLNIKNIMMIWTLLIIVCIAINLMFGSFYAMPTGLPTNATS